MENSININNFNNWASKFQPGHSDPELKQLSKHEIVTKTNKLFQRVKETTSLGKQKCDLNPLINTLRDKKISLERDYRGFKGFFKKVKDYVRNFFSGNGFKSDLTIVKNLINNLLLVEKCPSTAETIMQEIYDIREERLRVEGGKSPITEEETLQLLETQGEVKKLKKLKELSEDKNKYTSFINNECKKTVLHKLTKEQIRSVLISRKKYNESDINDAITRYYADLIPKTVQKVKPGVGLTNLQNTCYMNGALQFLRAVPNLRNELRLASKLIDPNTQNSSKSAEFASYILQTLNDMENSHSSLDKSTMQNFFNFMKSHGWYAESPSEQMDSGEFLQFVLSHSNLNNLNLHLKEKRTVPETDLETTNIWRSDQFGGQLPRAEDVNVVIKEIMEIKKSGRGTELRDLYLHIDAFKNLYENLNRSTRRTNSGVETLMITRSIYNLLRSDKDSKNINPLLQTNNREEFENIHSALSEDMKIFKNSPIQYDLFQSMKFIFNRLSDEHPLVKQISSCDLNSKEYNLLLEEIDKIQIPSLLSIFQAKQIEEEFEDLENIGEAQLQTAIEKALKNLTPQKIFDWSLKDFRDIRSGPTNENILHNLDFTFENSPPPPYFQQTVNRQVYLRGKDPFKFNTQIDFTKDVELLFTDPNDPSKKEKQTYRATSVLIHTGSGSYRKGHWTTLTREGNKWFYYNDSIKTEWNPKETGNRIDAETAYSKCHRILWTRVG